MGQALGFYSDALPLYVSKSKYLTLTIKSIRRIFVAGPNMFRVGVDETVVVSVIEPDGLALNMELYLRLPTSDPGDNLVTKVIQVQEGEFKLRIHRKLIFKRHHTFFFCHIGSCSSHILNLEIGRFTTVFKFMDGTSLETW